MDREKRHSLVIGLALLLGVLVWLYLARGCEPRKAAAYLGLYGAATTDSVTLVMAYTDSVGFTSNTLVPSSFKAILFQGGTAAPYDTVTRVHYPGRGILWTRARANNGGAYGTYFVQYLLTIQTIPVVRSDYWQACSLMTWDGNMKNLDVAVSAAGTLTAADKLILADTVATGNPKRWAALNDSVWTHYTRTLTEWGALVDSIWANADTLYAIVTDTVVCTVADTVYSYATMDSTTTAVLERILGLSQENYYMDDLDFTGSLLTQARVRLYEDSTYVGTTSGVLATYRITTTYDGNNVQTYKVVKE